MAKTNGSSRAVLLERRAWATAEEAAVREQLEQILVSPHFGSSKRCPAFLRHVVEATLKGHEERLKERTLGIELFCREPSYDTNSDTIVRRTAVEVRKKLAQYYCEANHAQELHVDLPPGSYVPTFSFASRESQEAGSAPEPHPAWSRSESHPMGKTPAFAVAGDIGSEYDEEGRRSTAKHAAARARNHAKYLLPALALLLLLGLPLGVWTVRVHARTNAIDEFWRPFIASPRTILVCVGQVYTTELHVPPSQTFGSLNQPLKIRTPEMGEVPVFVQEDAVAMARIAAVLQSRNKAYLIRDEATASFSDLKQSPIVLIGGYENKWTLRLNDRLRFYFSANPSSGEVWISDREKPGEKIGAHTPGVASPLNQAYAVVSRLYDPTTEQMTIIVAGRTRAMLAAAEFVANPAYLEDFSKRAPANWYKKNLQVLIRTTVVQGSTGPPEIIASYFW